MAKKSENWLVSYGDCITLLICLLITIVVVLQGQSEEDIEWVAEQVADITDLIQEAYPDTNIFKISPRASSFKVTLTGNIFESCKDKLNYDVIPLISSLGKDLIQNLHELNVMEKPDFIEDSLSAIAPPDATLAVSTVILLNPLILDPDLNKDAPLASTPLVTT